LHFEIRRNNEYVDPDLILDFWGVSNEKN
jgi:hypothetical protein